MRSVRSGVDSGKVVKEPSKEEADDEVLFAVPHAFIDWRALNIVRSGEERTMWVLWLLLVLMSIGLVISQVVLLVRDKISGCIPQAGEWSQKQYHLLKFLRISGAIGAIIVWSALVYVLIDLRGWHLMEPWRNKPQAWAAMYSLLYTSFYLALVRTPNFVPGHASWRPSSRLWFQAFIIVALFVATIASIADLYFSPPASRQVGALSARQELNGIAQISMAFVPARK